MSSSSKQNQTIALGIGAAVVTVSLLYYLFSSSSKAAADKPKGSGNDDEPSAGSRSLGATTPTKGATAADTDKTPLVKNNNANKALHSQIEELDKKGKALFKAKQVRLFVCCFRSFRGTSPSKILTHVWPLLSCSYARSFARSRV